MIICSGPKDSIPNIKNSELQNFLYEKKGVPGTASCGRSIFQEVLDGTISPSQRAWDLLTIALSVITADFYTLREKSPDGWTRKIELHIAVQDNDFWASQSSLLEKALSFLTTDIWELNFHPGGKKSPSKNKLIFPDEDCVTLISGGLDSLIGKIDLIETGARPFAASQIVRGDREKQESFAKGIGEKLGHTQVNHNIIIPSKAEDSQRARSFLFITYGILAASSLQKYKDGETTDLFLNENGFISINPPLTGSRLGSLSTRTAHPEFLGRLQDILDNAEIRVKIRNPYALKTKGQMLKECKNQDLLQELASTSTSCGRFQRFNYNHCGRCIPCQVRRASFMAWGNEDETNYIFSNLGKKDPDYSQFDDVRSVAIARETIKTTGIAHWAGNSINTRYIDSRKDYLIMLENGINELATLHDYFGVR